MKINKVENGKHEGTGKDWRTLEVSNDKGKEVARIWEYDRDAGSARLAGLPSRAYKRDGWKVVITNFQIKENKESTLQHRLDVTFDFTQAFGKGVQLEDVADDLLFQAVDAAIVQAAGIVRSQTNGDDSTYLDRVIQLAAKPIPYNGIVEHFGRTGRTAASDEDRLKALLAKMDKEAAAAILAEYANKK